MRAELKYKSLKHLNLRNQDEGFTLPEFLLFIGIIGILGPIWLFYYESYSFSHDAGKVRQSEAKIYVGSVNRSQQAYYAENGEFASDLETLKAGIPLETDSYTYTITEGGEGSFQVGIEAVANGDKREGLLSYAGLVFIDGETGDTQAVACQTTEASQQAPVIDAMLPEEAACGSEDAVMK